MISPYSLPQVYIQFIEILIQLKDFETLDISKMPNKRAKLIEMAKYLIDNEILKRVYYFDIELNSSYTAIRKYELVGPTKREREGLFRSSNVKSTQEYIKERLIEHNQQEVAKLAKQSSIEIDLEM